LSLVIAWTMPRPMDRALRLVLSKDHCSEREEFVAIEMKALSEHLGSVQRQDLHPLNYPRNERLVYETFRVLTDCLKTMPLSYFSDLGSNQPKPLAKFQPDSGRAPHQGTFEHLQGPETNCGF